MIKIGLKLFKYVTGVRKDHVDLKLYYPVIIDREMLDLGAVEVSKALMECVEGDNIDIFNHNKISKSFKVIRNEGIIHGRGIKTFLSGYADGVHYMVRDETGCFRLINNLKQQNRQPDISEKFRELSDVTKKPNDVLESLNKNRQEPLSWYQLYDKAKVFVSQTGNDELVCLPMLRDLDKYEYQIRTVKAVIGRFRGRALFCDEVGLGKTIEAGIAMTEYITRGMIRKILILVPPSLVEQWYTELKRKFNQDFIRYDDPEFKKAGDKAWELYPKVIASLGTAKRKPHSQLISDIYYDLVIVDEAHHLKNRKNLSWQFVNSINKKYIFLLTATPVQNNLEELYNLVTLLKPGQLNTYTNFRKQYVLDNVGLEVKNHSRLKELISGVMIRNRRCDVDNKFTRRYASTVGVHLSENEKEIYDGLSAFVKSRYINNSNKQNQISRFALKNLQEGMGSSFNAVSDTLIRMSENSEFKECDRILLSDYYEKMQHIIHGRNGQNTKITALLQILKKHTDKVIIFTKYRHSQELILSALKEEGIDCAYFNGNLRRSEKENQIANFRNKANVLVSTESGGEGRNLQFCNCLINFDLPWNPMAIEQRIGRIHRVGQLRDVYVYNLAAFGTIEQHILDLLDKKINMFELVVGEVDMILGDLEDVSDFSELIMDAWVRSNDAQEMDMEMDRLGEIMLENKKHYLKVKELGEQLFGGDLSVKEGGQS